MNPPFGFYIEFWVNPFGGLKRGPHRVFYRGNLFFPLSLFAGNIILFTPVWGVPPGAPNPGGSSSGDNRVGEGSL